MKNVWLAGAAIALAPGLAPMAANAQSAIPGNSPERASPSTGA